MTAFFAQVFQFLALSVAPVAIVLPLTRTVSIFTYVLSFFVNRRLETFGLRVIAGILLAVTGAVLILAA